MTATVRFPALTLSTLCGIVDALASTTDPDDPLLSLVRLTVTDGRLTLTGATRHCVTSVTIDQVETSGQARALVDAVGLSGGLAYKLTPGIGHPHMVVTDDAVVLHVERARAEVGVARPGSPYPSIETFVRQGDERRPRPIDAGIAVDPRYLVRAASTALRVCGEEPITMWQVERSAAIHMQASSSDGVTWRHVLMPTRMHLAGGETS
ncbi:hypothetical protein [Actinomyces urogenitalis]|uniref:hypothetical protein n=1 Tax=Actinomyces urogenitalis TaxID=103621 RepID=UPI00189AAA25|nr:hypothetical protein [Actinomyces urogenitalis]